MEVPRRTWSKQESALLQIHPARDASISPLTRQHPSHLARLCQLADDHVSRQQQSQQSCHMALFSKLLRCDDLASLCVLHKLQCAMTVLHIPERLNASKNVTSPSSRRSLF